MDYEVFADLCDLEQRKRYKWMQRKLTERTRESARLRTALAEAQRERDELRADLIFAASNSVYAQQVEKLFPNRGWVWEINAAPIFVEYDGTDTDLCRAIREDRRGE